MQKSLNKLLVLILLIFQSFAASAQKDQFRSDIEHINVSLSKIPPDPFKRPYIYRDESSVIKKFNPVSLLFGGSLYIYQNVLSKHISADCLFTPGCSEFSKQAIKEEGLIKGTFMSIDRVNRCNRIAAVDLRNYSLDHKTGKYPDPVSRYRKTTVHKGDKHD
jgi:uncharacterized protein